MASNNIFYIVTENSEMYADAVELHRIPVETVPVETVPVETVPVETVPVETIPVETVPVETMAVEAAKEYEDISGSCVHDGQHHTSLLVLQPLIISTPNQGDYNKEMIMMQMQEEVVGYYRSEDLQVTNLENKTAILADENNCFQETLAPLSPPSTSSSAYSHSRKDSGQGTKPSDKNSYAGGKARAASSSEVGSEKWEQEQVRVKSLEGVFAVTMCSACDERDHETRQAGEKLTLGYSEYLTGKKLPPGGIPGLDLSDPKQVAEFTRKKPQNTKEEPPRSIACPSKGCMKMFRDKSALRKHLHTHGPRVHVCAECGRAFVESSKLKRHQLVHTGEKPFQCTYEGCGKSFSLDFNLRTHMRIHTGERPFMCPFDYCNRTFTQSANLKTHILTHAKNKDRQ
ncbi:transcription factor YY2 [Monodon monoceros]|uniref:transcription factor YY2 n=1 Tax=Monodon monoceros TaxID=40151 RepID=UPI0010F7D1C1|nr:transcription factor YY2 [Monodon monoceros]